MDNNNWDYFSKDRHYSDVLKRRLENGEEMDSARALASYLREACSGDLHILDFGSGPGHYLPVIRKHYDKGRVDYLGVDIDASNIDFGNQYFKDDPRAEFKVGSVLEPVNCIPAEVNCIVSANTLPHVPTIEPLLRYLRDVPGVDVFVFRMLMGNGCTQIKSHLIEDNFDRLFQEDFQYNNIYSLPYLQHHLGPQWQVEVREDIFDVSRLEQHRLPAQEANPFYSNRVSRPVGNMVFKGDIYMPWKFVIGRRAVI